MDCMEAMKQFPDGFFDLAIVDPPYGDGNSSIGVGYGSEDCSTDTRRWNRFGQRFDRYKCQNLPMGGWHGKDSYHLGMLSEPEEHGQKSTAKKSSRGTLRRGKIIFRSFSASHATRSFGAGIILHSRQQGVFWYGAS